MKLTPDATLTPDGVVSLRIDPNLFTFTLLTYQR